jgi:serine/threonine protein kinase
VTPDDGKPMLERIGPYEVLSAMGQGGTGVVVKCRHVSTGGLAAVKRAHDRSVRQREVLRKEMAMLSRLAGRGHPGVVRVLDNGSDGGRLWYAMEFIEGPDLDSMVQSLWSGWVEGAASRTITAVANVAGAGNTAVAIAGGPASGTLASGPLAVPRPPAAAGHLREALDLLHRVAQVVDFIHREGVLHGDLKPNNIMFRADTGAAVLLDFGTALYAFAGSTLREIAQVERRRHGTPGYMAPEQIAGETLDARCDLYALGCILFELVTGRLPFVADDLHTLQGEHLHRAPPAPSALVDGVPAGLDDLILGLLAKDPRDRVGYAQDVCESLEQLLAEPRLRESATPLGRHLYRPRLAGREQDLDRLIEHLDRARQGKGNFVCVAGESGVGKTRLVNELGGRAVAERVEVVIGHCSDVTQSTEPSVSLRGAAFQPMLALLNRVFDRCSLPAGKQLCEDLAAALAVLTPYAPHLAELGPVRDHRPVELPHALARARVFRSLAEVIGRFAAHRPLLLILDDLHWADDLTLAFLRSRNLRDLEGAAVLMVGTYRTEQVDPELQAVMEGQPDRLIALQRLGLPAIRSMTKDMLASPLAPEGLAEFLHRHSEGNPFFAAEYLKATVARGLLRRDHDRRWSAPWLGARRPGDTGELPIPPSLQGVLELRTEGLSTAAAHLLELACVLGRQFGREQLLAFRGEMEPDAPQLGDEMLALEELVARQILEESGAGQYRFVHDKLRDARAQLLPPERRRALHATAAVRLEALATLQGQAASPLDAEIGSHWAEAGQPARAVPYLERAARAADAVHAQGQAIELALLALSQAETADAAGEPGGNERLAALGEFLADLLARAARHGEARTYLDWTLQRRGMTDVLAAARLHRKKAQSFWTLHEYDQAASALTAAEAILGEPAKLATPEHWREWIEVRQGQFWRYYFARRTGQATEQIIAALREPVEAQGTPMQRSVYYVCAALDILGRSRYRYDVRAVAYTRKAVAVVQSDERLTAQTALARFNLGFALLLGDRGEQEEAVKELQRTAAEAEAIGDVTVLARALTYLAVGQRRLGLTDEVSLTVDRALRAAEDAQLPPYLGAVNACAAWVAWRRGQPERAQSLVHEARTWWSQGDHAFPFRWLGTLLTLEDDARCGRTDRLGQTLDDLLDPQQHHLPPELDEALESTRDLLESNASPAQLFAALRRTLNIAGERGYL